MDLLLSTDVYSNFLKALASSAMPKDEIFRDLYLLLHNPHNRFIFSKALLDSIERAVEGNTIAESFMKPFFGHLINGGILNIASIEEDEKKITVTMHEKYLELPDKERRDVYINISFYSLNSINDSKSIVLERVAKPNFDWIWFNLASRSPQSITVRYYDFKTDAEIDDFFKCLLGLPQKKGSVDIFDKHANLDHQCFTPLVGMFVNYFTFIKHDDIQKRREISKCFKKVNIYTAKTANIHERRIMLNNLIIEVDDDFWNISCSRTTWKIDITYCATTRKLLGQKKQVFRLLR